MRIGVNYRLANSSVSGIPIFIKELYSRLPQIDKKNEYILFEGNGQSTILETLYFENVSLPIKCSNKKIDLLHGPSHTLPLTKQLSIKYLLTVHDLSFIKLRNMTSPAFKLIYANWLRRSVTLADHIVADSNNTRNDLVHEFAVPANKISTIYLAADPLFAPSFKKKLPKKYILTVATHPKRKNIELLIDAFIAIAQNCELRLVVVGKISESSMLKLSQAKLESRVDQLSNLPKERLVSLYQQAAVFVYPSRYEGFGLPVLEAMSCGIPALCADNSSLPEIQTDPEQRFEINDVEDLVDKLNGVLFGNKASEFAKKNMAASKRFSWEKTALSYQKIMHNIL